MYGVTMGTCSDGALFVPRVYREILHHTSDRKAPWASRLGPDPSRSDQTGQEKAEKRCVFYLENSSRLEMTFKIHG